MIEENTNEVNISEENNDLVSNADIEEEETTILEETSSSVSFPTQEDFYNFNENFVTVSFSVLLVLGILTGCLLGGLFRGIFKD